MNNLYLAILKAKKSKIGLLILLPILFQSCFKTSQQIYQERQSESKFKELEQTQKLVAELTFDMKQVQEKLNMTQGKIEEVAYQKNENAENSASPQTLIEMKNQMNLLLEENIKQEEEISVLQKQMSEQKEYLEKVIKLLGKVETSGKVTQLKDAKNTKKAISSTSKLDEANKEFENGNQLKAKALYLEILDENKITAAQKNLVLLNLGLINFDAKDYDLALSYFSKIYGQFPKSSLAPRALLYMARSFKFKNELPKAKATYMELMSNFPNSKQATLAKNEMQ